MKVGKNAFWLACEQLLNDEIGLAVDNRRHDFVTHVAPLVSVRDLWGGQSLELFTLNWECQYDLFMKT